MKARFDLTDLKFYTLVSQDLEHYHVPVHAEEHGELHASGW